ncbi:unnamed protein product [Calypogeia fissa]
MASRNLAQLEAQQQSERNVRIRRLVDEELPCPQAHRVHSNFTVKPKAESLVIPTTNSGHPQWLPLTNLDRVVNPTFVSVIFFYENVLQKDSRGYERAFQNVTTLLKNSLAKVLVEFYPLAGRLVLKEDVVVDLQCNDAGAIFIESSAKFKLLQMGGPQPMPMLSGMDVLDNVVKMGSACPLYIPDDVNPEIPVCVINVTKFLCGSIAVAANWHHMVADGFSGCHFMRSWAQIANGQELSLLPSHGRHLLKPRSPLNSSLVVHSGNYGSRPKMEPIPEVPVSHLHPSTALPSPKVDPILKVPVLRNGDPSPLNSSSTVVHDGTIDTMAEHEVCLTIDASAAPPSPKVNPIPVPVGNPHFDRSSALPSPKVDPIQVPVRNPDHPPRSPVLVKPFILTKDTIQMLKENVNQNREVVNTDISSSNKRPFTTTETLSAELWKLITKARVPDEEEIRRDRSRFFMFVDGRKRLGLPQGYFGNVVCSACAESTQDEILRRPISYAAGLISSATRAIDSEYFRSLIDWVEERRITSLTNNGACQSEHVNSTGFDVAATFWIFFPLYEINFGWGKPALSVRNAPPRKSIDGISVMPSPDGKGNMVALLNLHKDRMEKLERDPAFRETAQPLRRKTAGPHLELKVLGDSVLANHD